MDYEGIIVHTHLIAADLRADGFDDWKPKHIADEFVSLANVIQTLTIENARLREAAEKK